MKTKKRNLLIFLVIAIIIIVAMAYGLNSSKNVPVDVVKTDMETFVVGSQQVDCVGVAPRKCLVVNGEYFYNNIEGFEFEKGYKYEIRVRRELAFGTDDPSKIPADASMYKYKMIDLVSKTIDIPENCESWFDGCNNCFVEDGEIGGCTRKMCQQNETPKCLKYSS